MKKIVCLFCFFLFFAGGFVVNAEESYSNAIPIYRLYHSGVKEHLFTSDKNEYNVLLKRGWIQEGISWYAPTSGEKVTRLYSKITRKHLYSTDQNEIRTLLATKNWTSDGVVFLSGGSYGIYRLYHPGVKTHLSTVDANEFQVLGSRGWYQEGLSFKAQYLPSSNSQGVSVKIYNQSDLNNYLRKTGNDLSGDKIWFYNSEEIVFPRSTFFVDKSYFDIYFPSASGSVNFNGSTLLIGDAGTTVRYTGSQYSRKISNLTVFGSTGVADDYVPGSTYINPYINSSKHGGIAIQLYQTRDVNFENLIFNNCHPFDGHVFDIVGSENVSLNKIYIRGSAISKSISQTKLKELMQKNAHNIYSESVQIDSANPGSLGSDPLFDGSLSWSEIWWGLSYDGRPSKNVRITNSEFTSYVGPTGLGLIRGNNQSVEKYGAGLGGHSVGHSAYTGIVFDSLLVEGTIEVVGLQNNDLAPIKFLVVESQAMSLVGNEKVSFIRNSQIRRNMDIVVKNVRFVNTKKTGYYNQSGQYSDNSVWLSFYLDR